MRHPAPGPRYVCQGTRACRASFHALAELAFKRGSRLKVFPRVSRFRARFSHFPIRTRLRDPTVWDTRANFPRVFPVPVSRVHVRGNLLVQDSAQTVAGTHVANLTRRRTRAMRSMRRILTTRMTRAVLMVPLLLPVAVQIWRVRVCVRA